MAANWIACLENFEAFLNDTVLLLDRCHTCYQSSTSVADLGSILSGVIENQEILGSFISVFEPFESSINITLQSLYAKLLILLDFLNHHRVYFEEKLEEHHTECLHSKESPVKKNGRPKVIVDEEQVTGLRSLGMKWKVIANILGISEDTLRKNRLTFSSNKIAFSNISDSNLDNVVKEILQDNPCLGETMLRGNLLSKGFNIQRSRMRESMHRVFPERVEFNKRKIFRRTYSVPCPNALWHVDGNHKLIRWRFVIHGGVDGFSRLIVFLQCSSNNKSETVLKLFLESIQHFGIPIKLRTDHGTEKVSIARFMLETHGIEARPVITGKSVHNQRIERLWVDVYIYVTQQFRNIFYSLEEEGYLNPNNDLHLFVLHYIYLPRINGALDEFAQSWNCHPVRTEKNRSPLAIWTEGVYLCPSIIDLSAVDNALYGIDYNGSTPILETNNNVTVPEISIEIADTCKEYMNEHFNPLENDGNFDINLYCALLAYLQGSVL